MRNTPPGPTRPAERRRLSTRVVASLLTLPEWALRPVIGAGPIEMDGRVLNRRVQAMIAVDKRLGLEGADPTVEGRRRELRRATSIGMPIRTNVHVADRRIPGPGGPLPVRVYRRLGSLDAAPAIVYFHGGGWVVGDLDTHDGSCRLLAEVSGCIVVSVDYRLAPEHPFPAAVDDAIAAYGWVHAHTAELSVLPGRVGVMGDSAGGNLAAVVAQAAADHDLPSPVAQGLLYPALNARFDTPSHALFGEGFFLDATAIDWFRSRYLPDEADWDSLLASPALREDLSGLAPALVVTAGFDVLRDEGLAYADALATAGVPVVSRCYDDQVHGFFGMGVLPEGMAVASEICAAMGELMG